MITDRATHRIAPTGPGARTLGAIIGQFKSIVTKRINLEKAVHHRDTETRR